MQLLQKEIDRRNKTKPQPHASNKYACNRGKHWGTGCTYVQYIMHVLHPSIFDRHAFPSAARGGVIWQTKT